MAVMDLAVVAVLVATDFIWVAADLALSAAEDTLATFAVDDRVLAVVARAGDAALLVLARAVDAFADVLGADLDEVLADVFADDDLAAVVLDDVPVDVLAVDLRAVPVVFLAVPDVLFVRPAVPRLVVVRDAVLVGTETTPRND
ncbi:hypothetical protein [Thermomonospora umbrina]|nr:hypothetical protein [Thermomonospora umbrina]